MNAQAANYTTPLILAAHNGYLDTIATLLDDGDRDVKVQLEKEARNNISALFAASMNGHTNIIRLLARKGADIDHAMKHDVTPLYIACWKRRIDSVRVLVELGANVNKSKEFGTTPLCVNKTCNHTA